MGVGPHAGDGVDGVQELDGVHGETYEAKRSALLRWGRWGGGEAPAGRRTGRSQLEELAFPASGTAFSPQDSFSVGRVGFDRAKRMAPQVTAMSATLNAGQSNAPRCTCRKSVTVPF